jgi:pyranose oxidase
MVDAGASLSRRIGTHLKNSFLYQRDVNPFADVIRGHLHLLSVPTNNSPTVTLDPAAFAIDTSRYPGFVRNNQNPNQDPNKNLPGAAATYAVGGMATHWTCATPRLHPTLERGGIISDAEDAKWDALYNRAEKLLNTHTDAFDRSIRNTIVRDTLQATFPFSELRPPCHPQNLPLAVERRTEEHNDEFVTWSAADTVLGRLADSFESVNFRVLEQHRCTRVVPDERRDTIAYAEVEDLMEWRTIHFHANVYIICAGTVLTPQILFNSGIRPHALGLYLTEQPMAFCQIVLKQSIIDALLQDERFRDRIAQYRKTAPKDPIPIPMNDPEPQIWIPVSDGRPWHCQIHRDAFHYGELAPNVDSRLIVDLRWFGMVKQRAENRVCFNDDLKDTFGMPQPTFFYELDQADRSLQHEMMGDMVRAAAALGGFLPGSEPQFMPPGLTLHIHGTTRMGARNDGESVVDECSRVWGYRNLYLGGNGLIPKAIACNPTLTSVAIALRAADHIVHTGRNN